MQINLQRGSDNLEFFFSLFSINDPMPDLLHGQNRFDLLQLRRR